MTPLAAFTLVHVVISLIGILAGFVVLAGMLRGRHRQGWALWFLVLTVATSATGFLFPFVKLLPSHIVGIISLVVLAPAIYALYSRRLAGGWRKVYVIGSVVGLYFNVFVLVAQSFGKVPFLKALAPTQSEPPFAVAQLVVLVAFVGLGFFAMKRFWGLPVAGTAAIS